MLPIWAIKLHAGHLDKYEHDLNTIFNPNW